MNLSIQKKIEETPKMAELLKENSYWFKQLNRQEESYQEFTKFIKDKYRLRMSDKISDAIDNIDMISSILETLK